MLLLLQLEGEPTSEVLQVVLIRNSDGLLMGDAEHSPGHKSCPQEENQSINQSEHPSAVTALVH